MSASPRVKRRVRRSSHSRAGGANGSPEREIDTLRAQLADAERALAEWKARALRAEAQLARRGG